MVINKHDFLELEYSGKIKDTDDVFDTTVEKVAKDNNIFNSNIKYGPVIICVGEHQVITGLDEELIGKDLGKYTINIPMEKAFGKKDGKLLKLIPLRKFKKEKIQPMPGLQVQVDESTGIVKTVSGGRVIVDFNHPL